MGKDPNTLYTFDFYGSFQNDQLKAIAAHTWDHNILICAPNGVNDFGEALYETLKSKEEKINGFIGAHQNVTDLLKIFNCESFETKYKAQQIVMSLDLENMLSPKDAIRPELKIYLPEQKDLDLLSEWLYQFGTDSTGYKGGQQLQEKTRKNAEHHIREGQNYMLVNGTTPVSYAGFHVNRPEVVQIGPVWTPPESRGNGYAGILMYKYLNSLKGEVEKAILSTVNPDAIKAYEKIGFKQNQERYSFHLFEQTHSL